MTKKAIDVFIDESEESLKTGHCWNCGFVLCQYFGRAEIIVPATVISHKDFNSMIDPVIKGRKERAPLIIQCHNKSCKFRYNIK